MVHNPAFLSAFAATEYAGTRVSRVVRLNGFLTFVACTLVRSYAGSERRMRELVRVGQRSCKKVHLLFRTAIHATVDRKERRDERLIGMGRHDIITSGGVRIYVCVVYLQCTRCSSLPTISFTCGVFQVS